DRVVACDGTRRWNPESGQFLFNFDANRLAPPAGRLAQLRELPGAAELPNLSAEQWCDLAMDIEDGSPLEARAAYHHALDLDPGHVVARINLGRLLHGAGNLIGAEAHFREALRHDPHCALAWYDLGVVLEDAERAAEALPCYEAAVQADETLADAHWNLSLLYEPAGRRHEAIRHLAIYRRLAPQPPRASRRGQRHADRVPRGNVRLQLSGVARFVLSREAAGRRYARLLRRRLSHGRDQQHVLPDAGPGAARLLDRADAWTLPLRAQGAAADHAPATPEGGRRAGARVRTAERGAGRQARPPALPASSQPEGRPVPAPGLPRGPSSRHRARVRVPARFVVPGRHLGAAARARRRALHRPDRRARDAAGRHRGFRLRPPPSWRIRAR